MSTIQNSVSSTGAADSRSPAIIVTDLAKSYHYHRKEPGLRGSLKSLVRRQMRENRAVDGVSFSIQQGEVVGFLGPNGAGKTTTLKMLSGLLYPDRGSVSVLDYTPSRREPAYLRRISLVMGQKSMLMWDVPALETLLLHKELYRMSGAAFRSTLDRLAEMLDVGHLLRVQVRKLSLGERMKMELLAALIYRPEILFLDEPTIGLDVVAQQRVREFLHELNAQQGTTILLTSHYMNDIQALCPRVLVIDHGRIGYDGPLTGLIARTASQKFLTVVFSEPVSQAQVLAAVGDVQILPADDPLRIRLAVSRERVADVAGELLRLGQVADINIEEPPVEDVIRDVFGTAVRERSIS